MSPEKPCCESQADVTRPMLRDAAITRLSDIEAKTAVDEIARLGKRESDLDDTEDGASGGVGVELLSTTASHTRRETMERKKADTARKGRPR